MSCKVFALIKLAWISLKSFFGGKAFTNTHVSEGMRRGSPTFHYYMHNSQVDERMDMYRSDAGLVQGESHL